MIKVLLVDDEKKFASMLAKRLEIRGVQADFVYTGEDAIMKLRNGKRFDVAVLDVKMPGIGGIELRRRLSELDREMKFVFLTGHGSSLDYAVGATEAAYYLSKPIKIDNLVETLHNLTSQGE